LSLCLAEVLTAWFRNSISELATLPPGESVVFCLLAGGELAGDEPKSNGVCFLAGGESTGDEPKSKGFRFFGVVICDEVRDDPLELRVPIKY
jgi:hypothetical protein